MFHWPSLIIVHDPRGATECFEHAIFREQLERQAVERCGRETFTARDVRGGEFPVEIACCNTGEGHGKNLFWGNALLQQPSDPLLHRERLASAWPRKHPDPHSLGRGNSECRRAGDKRVAPNHQINFACACSVFSSPLILRGFASGSECMQQPCGGRAGGRGEAFARGTLDVGGRGRPAGGVELGMSAAGPPPEPVTCKPKRSAPPSRGRPIPVDSLVRALRRPTPATPPHRAGASVGRVAGVGSRGRRHWGGRRRAAPGTCGAQAWSHLDAPSGAAGGRLHVSRTRFAGRPRSHRRRSGTVRGGGSAEFRGSLCSAGAIGRTMNGCPGGVVIPHDSQGLTAANVGPAR